LCFAANLQLGACLHATREFKEATEQCWNVLTLAPRYAPAQLLLALSYEQLGMYEEALIELKNAGNCVSFEAAAVSGMGEVFGLTGLRNEAHECFLKLSKQAESRYISPYWHAVFHAGEREDQKALSCLEDCLRERDPALLSLGADARFDVIREDKRFQVILREMGVRGGDSVRHVGRTATA
jgi:tetratricopeptide (TPR) repeat protein